MWVIVQRVLGFGLGVGLGWSIERSFRWFVDLMTTRDTRLEIAVTKSILLLVGRWTGLVIVLAGIFWLWRGAVVALALGLLGYQTARLVRMIAFPRSYGRTRGSD